MITDADPATCYPSFQSELENKESIGDIVVDANRIITSQGPGTAIPFALQIIQSLMGQAEAVKVAKGLLYKWPLESASEL